ncbi:DUF2971 domain-containing protein [uncultured Ruegeria sp.]|uniref:DUF2971 domain-containing protein n=1 Tax=uncultured Ruegeria sp. TaxID=259304 RepID=UPI00260291C2|nr:DUF2971 domain-containing protein [uncultured Ruegeria sp.]
MNSKGTIIGKITRRTKIYRVFPRDRFFQLFEESNNVLVRPTMWDDPFENFILRSPVRTASGEKGEFAFHKDLYGQCWTLHTASDAMWRIYSPEKDAVRVRTTVGRLLDSLCAANKGTENDSCYIGKVDYPTEAKLKTFARTIFKDGLTARAVANSLLAKRKAFEHEKEVRIIFFEGGQTVHENGVYKYPLDPHAVFDQVMLDPRMSTEEYARFKEDIVKKTGFDKTRIKRSLIYKPPEGFVIEIP